MELQERINQYWSARADEFSDARLADYREYKKERWLEEIKKALPAKKEIHALDLGTGAGFFALILRELGCHVTGIDYSDSMVSHARENAQVLGFSDIRFYQMDAQELAFEDGSFDFIFTRNVTWTLPHPQKAYSEMVRVLSEGGRIMNCDANYGAAFREADRTGATEKSAVSEYHQKYARPAQSLSMLRERNDIANQLSISDMLRPQWDVSVLLELGIKRLSLDLEIGDRILREEAPASSLWHNPSPLFMVLAEK